MPEPTINDSLNRAPRARTTGRSSRRRSGRHSRRWQRTRRRLRLVLITITVLLLALGFAVAHFAAIHAQRAYQRFVHLTAEPGIYRAVERQYQRGWISSQAVTELIFNRQWLKSVFGIDTGGRPVTLLLDHHIQHGPLLFPQGGGLSFGVALISTQLDMSSPAMQQLRNRFSDGVPFIAETRIDFSGATDTEMQVPRGEVPPGFDGNHEQVGVIWDGFTGFLVTSPHLRHYEVAVDSGGIRLTGPFGNLQVLSATVTGDGTRDRDGHWNNRQRVSLQRILAHDPRDTFSDGLDIESTHVMTSDASDANTTRASSQWQLRNIRVGATHIRSLDADVQVTHWNDATLEWLARLALGTLSQRGAKRSPPAVPSAVKRSVITVRNLRIHMHNGTAEGQFALVYDAHGEANPEDMIPSISGHGTLAAPANLVKSLVESYVRRRLAAQAAVDPSVPTDPAVVAHEATTRSARHISTLLKEGALQRDGSQLTSTLQIHDGKVTAAGVPVAKLLPRMPAN